MSLLSERVYLMEYKQKRKEREQEEHKKEIEKLQRKKEQESERKEYEKGVLLSCKNELKRRFEEDFRLQGLQAKYQFYDISTRDAIIKGIAKSELEGDYLETNYNKILNEIIKKYELNEQYKREKEKEIARHYIQEMTPTWEAERKKQERKNIRNNILLFILGIFEHPFILLTLIIIGVFVWAFMGAFGFGFFKAVGLSIIIFTILVGVFFGFIK